ncbi:expressed unknown protein [Seminavis robusta]|uniref:Transmembrane protein n=1 Tax=Seminavis robusta TaxID=568900 RepID=A0A9N8DZ73_9STRA|nr:expressed unknown protein [Seminavis robusta]|eukprot:Sro407_g136620.1 n/a (96) ;mRNA; f:22143-22518
MTSSKPSKDDIDSSNNSGQTVCLEDEPSFRPCMLQVRRLQSVDEEAVLKEEEEEVQHPCKRTFKPKYIVGAAFLVATIIFAVFMIGWMKNSTLAS